MIMVATASDSGWRWTFPFPRLSSSCCKSNRNATATLCLPTKLHDNIVASSESKAKRANLSASRTQRVNLPVYDWTSEGGQPYHISQFLRHPSGIQAILNTSALQNFQFLDTNAYRCTLPKLAFFNFEATPVLDLRVIPTEEDCTVELFSCKIYSQPFILLPISAVERPGNLMIQALVDRLVPLLLQQLLQDYNKWVHQKLRNH